MLELGGILVAAVYHIVNLHMLANCCVYNYTPIEKHGLRITFAYKFSYLRSLALFLFTLDIPPSWRHVMTMTLMTSLHLMHRAYGKYYTRYSVYLHIVYRPDHKHQLWVQ